MSQTSTRRFWVDLSKLGFTSYREYLLSPHWTDVKRRYRVSKMPKLCLACGKPYEVLHHRTYKRLGHEWLMDLAALCHNCHRRLHDRENKRSRGGLFGTTNSFVHQERRKNGWVKRGGGKADRHWQGLVKKT